MKGMDYIDIHDYPMMYKLAVQSLGRSGISEKNKELIMKYDQTESLVDRIGIPRRTRVVIFLHQFARDYLKRDFQDATKDDLKNAMTLVDGRQDYSVWTKKGFRTTVKKFYRWLEYGDDYLSPENKHRFPERVAWMSSTIPRKDIPLIGPEDILTEVEIVKLLEAASDHARNEALVATLYEGGCRIGEHGGIRLKHVVKEEGFFTITVKGKTGTREVVIAKFASILANWLNAHPYKDDPEAPLWVKMHSKDPLMYRALSKLLVKLAKKAGITKRIYPHIFRHSRATHGIVNEEFTEEGAKKLFGWTPDSKMLETYIHLTSRDVKDKYLEKLGLRKREQEGSILDPKVCPECKHPNLFNASLCEKCRALLDPKIGISMDKRLVAMKELLDALCKDNYIKFRVAEMARQNASLLDVLKTAASEGEKVA